VTAHYGRCLAAGVPCPMHARGTSLYRRTAQPPAAGQRQEPQHVARSNRRRDQRPLSDDRRLEPTTAPHPHCGEGGTRGTSRTPGRKSAGVCAGCKRCREAAAAAARPVILAGVRCSAICITPTKLGAPGCTIARLSSPTLQDAARGPGRSFGTPTRARGSASSSHRSFSPNREMAQAVCTPTLVLAGVGGRRGVRAMLQGRLVFCQAASVVAALRGGGIRPTCGPGLRMRIPGSC